VRAAVRHTRPRRFGRIIVTTSLAATRVEPAIGAAYMTAKAGARHLAFDRAGVFVTNIGGGHAHHPNVQAAVARDAPCSRRSSG
jgi:NAD(P)-dependent dehydrogenase (short-subunit alcohol dehydrogenase family)